MVTCGHPRAVDRMGPYNREAAGSETEIRCQKQRWGEGAMSPGVWAPPKAGKGQEGILPENSASHTHGKRGWSRRSDWHNSQC